MTAVQTELTTAWLGPEGFLSGPGYAEIPAILRQGNRLIIGERTIKLPRDRFALASEITSGNLPHWEEALQAIRSLTRSKGLVLIAYDDPLRELVLLGASRGLFDFGLVFQTAPTRFVAGDHPLLTSSRVMIFSDAGVETAFRQLYLGHYTSAMVADGGECLSTRLLPRPDPAPARCSQARDKVMRVLLVAYYAGPARTVGVKRVNYWLEHMRDVDPAIEVEIISATAWEAPSTGQHVVPDPGYAALVLPNGSTEPWAKSFIASDQAMSRMTTTLSATWRLALERYFDARHDQFDVVIISGNPFAVFDFATYAKRRWYARTVLDYRDPFANNPRMSYSPEARTWAKYIERGYNFQSDLVLVVNDDCVPMVEGKSSPVLVVANGFDENDVPPAQQRQSAHDGLTHFVHAGTIFHDRSPAALIQALDPLQHRLHHIGNQTGIEAPLLTNSALSLHGTRPYPEVMQLISQADCGIVFVSETGFETPTKLYDYLAYGLDILIIKHGKLHVGALVEVLKDMPGVFWVENTPEALAAFVMEYRPSKDRRGADQTFTFSRRAGTERLIATLRDMTGIPCPDFTGKTHDV